MSVASNLQMRDLFAGRRVFWVCFFGSYCVGLHHLLPIEGVGCLDDGSELDLVNSDLGIRFCTVEDPGRDRVNWIGTSIDTVFERAGRKIVQFLTAGAVESWLVVSSSASPRLEAYCCESGLIFVGPETNPQVDFHSKATLDRMIQETGLPRAPSQWRSPNELDYRSLTSVLGDVLVIQENRGSAGSGTYLVADFDGFRKALARLPHAPVRVSPVLGRLSLNINAAVIDRNICVGFPNVQLSGVRELGAPWGGYCGNDYSAAAKLDSALVSDIQYQTEIAGHWLLRSGFQGIYGLDFVVSETDGRPYPVDLNPRWQGSTALSIQAELEQKRLPLAAANLGYRCGVLTSRDIRASVDQFPLPLQGSQLCLRLPEPEPHFVKHKVSAGVYRQGSRLDFVRPGISLSDCRKEGEWLLSGGVPRLGTRVEGGAWLARAFSRDSVTEGTSSSELSEPARKAARQFFAQFNLQPTPSPESQ